MSAQAKQYLDWSSEVDYPLSSSGGLPTSAILDARGFTRISPTSAILLQSISGLGDSLVAHFTLSVAEADLPTLHFDLAVNTAGLRSGSTPSVTCSASTDSPWMSGHGFLLAGLSVTFGPGMVDKGGWTPSSPLEVEPALLADLSYLGIYRLRARRIISGVSSLVDLGGVLTVTDGHNLSAIMDSSNNRLFFDVERGFGTGIHTRGWPFGADTGTCNGTVRTIDGAPPDSLGTMTFIGSGGMEVLSDALHHRLTLRVARVSQTGVSC